MEKLLISKGYAIHFNRIEETDGADHWMTFRVVQVVSGPEGKFYNYDTGGGLSDSYDVPDMRGFEAAYEQNKLCNGHIKWDGCMELHDLNYHFCGYDTILQDIVRDIYLNAKELMPKSFDEDLAQMKNIK